MLCRVLISGGQTTLASGATAADIGTTIGYTTVPVAIIIGILVALFAGALNGLIVSKTKTMPLIITLGMSGVYYGIALIITGGRFHSFMLVFEGLRVARIVNVIPVTLVIFFFMVGVAFVLVNRTKFGRRIVAIGGNEEAAFLSGIKVDRYKIMTYTISGLFCGIAAILYATRLNSITAERGQVMNLMPFDRLRNRRHNL
ncbi:MAG: ABC transporter permease [Actinomycetota bacterium]|nr:ABC transporter permease [Actinomycetota bacterium]